jgi:hypothetical protein
MTKPLTPVRPMGMEIVFLYPCPHCAREVTLIAPTRPSMAQCDACRKNFPIVPEAVLGTFGGGPTDAVISGGGGGSQEKCFAIGKTTSQSDKSASSTTSVEVWAWNGSSHSGTGTPLSVYNLFGSISANRFVAIAKDIDTDKWYITAAECG